MQQEQEDRKTLIRTLLDQPFYLALNARLRLNLVRKMEDGLELSTVVFHMKAWHWIKTGKIY